MPDKLPNGWVKTTLGEINVPSRARALPREVPQLPYVGMEHVEAQTMKLLGQGSASGLKSSSVRFNQGDVLYGKMRPYLNKVWLAEFDGLCSAEFLVFPKTDGLNAQLFAYRLNSQDFVNFANHQVSGDRPRVDFEKLANFAYLLAPSPEQERIVAKLDALLSRVAAGEAAARRALERLKRYRAAVLHAAVTGELTRDWRKKNSALRTPHSAFESGQQLLKRLLHERRARWEAAELKRLQAAGKPPKDDKWKERYPEPNEIDISELPQLPEGWTWSGLQQLGFIVGGLTKNPKRAVLPLKMPYLRVGNVYANELRLAEVKTIGVEKDELDKLLLEKGDLLIVEGNGSKDQIGRLAIWDGSIEKCVHQNHIIKVRLVENELGSWILSWLLSPSGRHYVEKVASSTTGLYTLSVGKVGNLPIALPPTDEQTVISTEVDRRMAAAERLAATLDRQLERARATRQSLLREAFAGKLVPQDSKDEPASALLERIRAARETETQKPKVKKKRVTKPRAKRLPTRPKRPSSDGGRKPPTLVESVLVEASQPRPRQMRLIRLKLFEDFNSLKAADFTLRSRAMKPERLAPICLVGLNGSGKSNLIEVLSEIFCHVELALLPWQEIKPKQRVIELRFELEYQLLTSGTVQPTTVRLEKPNQHPVVFKIIREGGEEVVPDPAQCLSLLPTRIIGYSSGLNETISIPYFRTAAVYSDEVLKQAGREEKQPNSSLPDVLDSRTVYLDYECNALILIANYLLQPKTRLRLLRRELRIDSISTFDIRFRPTYQGKKPVRLTKELKRYIAAIRKCADSAERNPDGVTEVFHFNNPKAAAARLKSAFGTPDQFFRALYKLSLLNPLALKGKKREFYLRSDVRSGQLERPPTISREDRIFSVEQIRVNLTKPKRAIDYAGISDGEHQFLQFFGSVLLFHEPGCVFLLDEPETHFNPQWRRLGIQWLANIKSTSRQELLISTHSPFVVSGCKGRNVFKFKREGDQCICFAADIETFGASNDFLLARLFDLESMIAGEAVEEMRALLKDGRIKELRKALPRFGESLEKRFIYERIAKLEQKKKRKK